MVRNLALGWFVLCLLCTACSEKSVLLPYEEIEPHLVVLAYAIDGVRPQVFISKLLPFDTDTVQYGLPDAEVLLYKNNEVETELHYLQVQDCGDQIGDNGVCLFRSSRHVSDDTLHLEYGAIYHVEVKAPGFPTVRSEPVVATQSLQNLEARAIVSDSVTPSGWTSGLVLDTIDIRYDYIGNPTDQLYITLSAGFNFLHEDWRRSPLMNPTDHGRLKLNPFNSDFHLIRPGPYFFYDDHFLTQSFSLHITRYPAGFARFYDLIEMQDSDISGLYASAPAPIPTNIIGGEGYFVIIEHYKIGDFIVEQ